MSKKPQRPSNARNSALRKLIEKDSGQWPKTGGIFVSYASADRPAASELVEWLRREGYPTFWDRDVEAGADFHKRINKALDESSVALVLWSKNSVRSDFVVAEASKALRDGKLIPLSLDGFSELDVPIPFRNLREAPAKDRDFLRLAFRRKGIELKGSPSSTDGAQTRHSVSVSLQASVAIDTLSKKTGEQESLSQLMALLGEYRVQGPIALAPFIEKADAEPIADDRSSIRLLISFDRIKATLAIDKSDYSLVLEGIERNRK